MGRMGVLRMQGEKGRRMSEYIYWTQGKPEQDENGLISIPRERVVRCRDCKEYIERKGYATCGYFGGDYVEIEPDGFCKWGERRAD